MVRRISVGAVVAVLICSMSVSAQTAPARSADSTDLTSRGFATAPRRASGSPVEVLLQKPVERLDWSDEVTFEEVIDWLEEESDGKVNIVPRWRALEEEGIDADKGITLKLQNATVGLVLSEVLDQLSETGEATFRGSQNTLRISTKRDFDRKLEIRVYNVTDVLFRLPDFSESAPQIDLQQQTGGARGQQSSQPVFRTAGGQGSEELSEEGEQDPEEVLEDLAELIRTTIAPDSWEEAGGLGRIQGFNKRVLVVRNTVDVHEQIAGYFSLDR